MSPEKLSEIAERALGRQWPSALAHLLGVSERTMARWRNGSREIPLGVERDILAIVGRVEKRGA